MDQQHGWIVDLDGAKEHPHDLAVVAVLFGLTHSPCRIGHLIEREGGFQAESPWEEQLSLGEQQRLAMARLFYHRPVFGVLDECTNATSTDIEAALYEYAVGAGITLITISQRTALLAYHKHELRLLDGQGNWELVEHR
mmetsp:Transcript_38388/g.91045  ORF Transcript_38388/g.91045 Transcript_38388/m.91045 type:complete len:139 (+) Transcript_38388:3969-4385(+)